MIALLKLLPVKHRLLASEIKYNVDWGTILISNNQNI